MNPAGPNAFGIVPRRPSDADVERALDSWASVVEELEGLIQLTKRDAAVAVASGRWRPGHPDPEEYVPGDVVALRAFSVTADLYRVRHYQEVLLAARQGRTAVEDDVRAEIVSRTLLSLADTRSLFAAVPHYLDAKTAVGVLASRPPEADAMAELRLPYPRTAVYFGRPLALGPELHDWPAAWDQLFDVDDGPTGTRTAIGDLRAVGGGLEGVVLTEGPGGGLADEVLWLISANPDPTRPGHAALDRYRATVWGRLSSARLSHVAHNLAATVSWAEWQEPGRPLDLPDDPGSRLWRKTVRRGEFRRREPRGAAAGVRVLDVGRTPVADRVRGGAVDPNRSSPATHLRRAHWRMQPVGPGLKQRRLVRVPATVVNAGATPLGDVVYRVPAPDPDRADIGPTGKEEVIDLRSIDLPPASGADADKRAAAAPERDGPNRSEAPVPEVAR